MRIGIFGGTFDPPHIGHIAAFKSFLEQFEFDCAYVIPALVPPHKRLESDVSAKDRLEMTRLAFESISEKVIVSDLEMKRQGKSYTADTIKYFKDLGSDDIYFLCGTDMLLTLDLWYKPEYIMENSKIVFARRENLAENTEMIAKKILEYKENFGAEIYELKTKVLEISSTEIRQRINCGEYGFLTPPVAKYIDENGLYKDR